MIALIDTKFNQVGPQNSLSVASTDGIWKFTDMYIIEALLASIATSMDCISHVWQEPGQLPWTGTWGDGVWSRIQRTTQQWMYVDSTCTYQFWEACIYIYIYIHTWESLSVFLFCLSLHTAVSVAEATKTFQWALIGGVCGGLVVICIGLAVVVLIVVMCTLLKESTHLPLESQWCIIV